MSGLDTIVICRQFVDFKVKLVLRGGDIDLKAVKDTEVMRRQVKFALLTGELREAKAGDQAEEKKLHCLEASRGDERLQDWGMRGADFT